MFSVSHWIQYDMFKFVFLVCAELNNILCNFVVDEDATKFSEEEFLSNSK